jgi:hypothetical protein
LPIFVGIRRNFVTGKLNWTLSIVPPSIGWLDFGQNTFSGTIPHEIGRLTNLTYLGLDANNLEGNLPTELGLLTMLTVLYLDNIRLSGTIPTELYVHEKYHCKLWQAILEVLTSLFGSLHVTGETSPTCASFTFITLRWLGRFQVG